MVISCNFTIKWHTNGKQKHSEVFWNHLSRYHPKVSGAGATPAGLRRFRRKERPTEGHHLPDGHLVKRLKSWSYVKAMGWIIPFWFEWELRGFTWELPGNYLKFTWDLLVFCWSLNRWNFQGIWSCNRSVIQWRNLGEFNVPIFCESNGDIFQLNQ